MVIFEGRNVSNLYLFQKNLLVCYSITASAAGTVGPMTLIFEAIVGHES